MTPYLQFRVPALDLPMNYRLAQLLRIHALHALSVYSGLV